MGLPHRTRVYLQGEGIDHPSDLEEFIEKGGLDLDRLGMQEAFSSRWRRGVLQNQVPFQLPAKSLLRLRVAAKVVEFYSRTSRPLTAANMSWTRLANFKIE